MRKVSTVDEQILMIEVYNQKQRICVCVCERIEKDKSCTKESRKKYLNIINKLKNNQT